MNCTDVQKQLADYSAGFVQGEARQWLQEHLASCGACREHLQELRALDRLMAADRVEAGEALVRRIMSRVRVEQVRPRGRWIYVLAGLGPAVAAASVLCVIILFVAQHAAQWSALVSAPQASWNIPPDVQPAVVLLLGMALVAGVVWIGDRLAEALT